MGNVEVKQLHELCVDLVETGTLYCTVKMEVPKYLLWDFLCEGVTFQAKEEATPHLMYAPIEWQDRDGKKVVPKGALRNPQMEALKNFHKAYETYRLFHDAGTDVELAKQLLPSCNIVKVTATALRENWEKWLNKMSLSKREDYNHYAGKIRGIIHA